AKSQVLSNLLDVAHQFIKKVNPDEPKGENHSTKGISESQHKTKSLLLQGSSSEVELSTTKEECANTGDRLLCEGPFVEQAPAQSFQEVLKQWRTGHHDDNEKQKLHAAKPESLEECEVQTNLRIWTEPLMIEFKEDSLSYMEKLWLKKHRRTPQEQLQNMLVDTFVPQCKTGSEAQCSQNENDEDSDVEDIKIQPPALFLPVEELNIERPEPSLKIVELDDTDEAEFEEPGNVVPYKVELADADSQQRFYCIYFNKLGLLTFLYIISFNSILLLVPKHESCTFHDYQNTFLYENDIHQHHIFTKGKTHLLHLHLSNNTSYCKDNSKGTSSADFGDIVNPDAHSPAAEKIEENSFFEINFKEDSIDIESSQKYDDSCISLESKDSLPSTDLEKASFKGKLSQEDKASLEFSNLHERPNSEESKTTESPLLLQEIALRSKPITEQYQGLERFFVFDKNERLNLLPSHSLECNYSSTRITIAGDREWIPDHSVSAYADNAVALGVLKRAQNASSRRTQQKTGWTSQRPSTANLPLCNSSRNTAARSLSRAEISEIEYIDDTDHDEPFLDDTADQQTLDSLEKELNALRNPAGNAISEISEIEYIDDTDHDEPFLDDTADQQTLDSLEKELNALRNPAEKLYSLTSEELPAFNNHSLNTSQTTQNFHKSSRARDPCGVEEQSSSEKDTEIQSLLTVSESSTDEEEEDFLDEQHVITLPWSKST
ncbi:hypothetical protein EI555_005091, partial [Monodon monoceros]